MGQPRGSVPSVKPGGQGSSGVWGCGPKPAHPRISAAGYRSSPGIRRAPMGARWTAWRRLASAPRLQARAWSAAYMLPTAFAVDGGHQIWRKRRRGVTLGQQRRGGSGDLSRMPASVTSGVADAGRQRMTIPAAAACWQQYRRSAGQMTAASTTIPGTSTRRRHRHRVASRRRPQTNSRHHPIRHARACRAHPAFRTVETN
jgi:hypothetical protein